MCKWLAGVRDQVLQDQEFLRGEVDNASARTFDLVGP
jgi:hypothetical protein